MEGDAVDGEDVVLEVEIVFKNVADEPREVVVEDEVDGLPRRSGIRLRVASLLLPFPTRLVCTQSEPIALLLTRWRFDREDQAKVPADPFPIRALRSRLDCFAPSSPVGPESGLP